MLLMSYLCEIVYVAKLCVCVCARARQSRVYRKFP